MIQYKSWTTNTQKASQWNHVAWMTDSSTTLPSKKKTRVYMGTTSLLTTTYKIVRIHAQIFYSLSTIFYWRFVMCNNLPISFSCETFRIRYPTRTGQWCSFIHSMDPNNVKATFWM